MEFIVVLDPTSKAARAHAQPDGLPYFLAATENDAPVICPTLRCSFLDTSQPQFMRAALLADADGKSMIVWLPLSAVLTVLEANESTRVAFGFSTEIH